MEKGNYRGTQRLFLEKQILPRIFLFLEGGKKFLDDRSTRAQFSKLI